MWNARVTQRAGVMMPFSLNSCEYGPCTARNPHGLACPDCPDGRGQRAHTYKQVKEGRKGLGDVLLMRCPAGQNPPAHARPCCCWRSRSLRLTGWLSRHAWVCSAAQMREERAGATQITARSIHGGKGTCGIVAVFWRSMIQCKAKAHMPSEVCRCHEGR